MDNFVVEVESDGIARFFQCDIYSDASVLYHALVKSGEFDYVFIRVNGNVVQTWAKF